MIYTPILPEQRVSESAKKKPEWYVPMTDYIIDKAISLNDKSKINKLLEACDGNIDDSTFKYATSNFGIDSGNKFPNTTREFSIILPIFRRYMGEYVRQYKNFQVYHKDADIISERNKKLKDDIETIIRKILLNHIQENGLDAGVQQEQQPDIPQYIAEEKRKYLDDKIIESQKILGLITAITNSELEYIKAFKYWFACENVISYRKVLDNDIHKEIISPLEYYRIPSDNIFVEDDEQGMRKYRLTLNQIYEHFDDKLSKSDKDYLHSISFKLNEYNKTSNITSRIFNLSNRDEWYYFSSISSGSVEFNPNDWSSYVDVYHCVYKAPFKYGVLVYIDLDGQVKETVVDETYKLNPLRGDLDIKWDYVTKVYESLRIGDKIQGIYIKPNLVNPQRQDVNKQYRCKLPYNGITGVFKNNSNTSIINNLLPYEALYRVFHLERERAISRFTEGFFILPESLFGDTDELTRTDRLTYARRDKKLWIDDTDASVNSLQALRFIGDGGAAVQYIQTLDMIIQSLKNEAWEAADMNNSRMGDINAQQGKAVTEYAINRASAGSILLFTLFNKFVESDYEADIDYAKVAWYNGKYGSFIDPKTGKAIYINIEPYSLFNKNIGVFVGNSPINDEKLKQYRNLAFSAAQNGDFNIAADSIELENSADIHRLIKQATEQKKLFEQQLNERQAKATEFASQQSLENNREQRELEKYKIDMSYKEVIDATKIKAGIQTLTIQSNENIELSKNNNIQSKENTETLNIEK